jgi:hypothetical protein
LREIKHCMGGEDNNGWDAPEDVWGIATKALTTPPTTDAPAGEPNSAT